MPVSIKKHRASRDWLARHINDPYVKQARAKGYRARSAFKFTELDDKFKLIKQGQKIVDLGAAPGSWCQVISERTRVDGVQRNAILALDLLEMEPVAGVTFIQGDFREDEILAQITAWLGGSKVGLVVSDLSPNLSGVATADAARMELLLELCLEFALAHLAPDGTLVMKAFHGSGYSQMFKRFKDAFVTVEAYKPKASRDDSAETYVVARRLKNKAPSETLPA
jgi:23S rRNA (uridine2552-2'-O)-methyltransferase